MELIIMCQTYISLWISCIIMSGKWWVPRLAACWINRQEQEKNRQAVSLWASSLPAGSNLINRSCMSRQWNNETVRRLSHEVIIDWYLTSAQQLFFFHFLLLALGFNLENDSKKCLTKAGETLYVIQEAGWQMKGINLSNQPAEPSRTWETYALSFTSGSGLV